MRICVNPEKTVTARFSAKIIYLIFERKTLNGKIERHNQMTVSSDRTALAHTYTLAHSLNAITADAAVQFRCAFVRLLSLSPPIRAAARSRFYYVIRFFRRLQLNEEKRKTRCR